MKKVIFKILGGLIVAIFILQYTGMVYADEISELQEQQSSNEEELKEAEEQKEQVTQEKSETLQQIEEIESQITDYEDQISELETKIENLNTQITEAEEQISQKEEDYASQKELLEKRLVVTYESGETSFLDVLLSSKNIVDLISNYYMISEIAEADLNLMESIENERKEIEEAKATLEQNKQELDSSKSEKESISVQLQEAKEEKNEYVAQLSSEEQELQAVIDELAEANEEIDEQIKAAQAAIEKAKQEAAAKAAAQNSSNSSNSSGSSNSSSSSSSSSSASTTQSSYGFIWPVSTKYSITTGWYYSNGSVHGAVDFSGSGISGTSVYAVADGYVVTSTASKDSSGNYTSYGNYVIIAHYNGLYTLYAHMNSRSVSAGETVTQGQVIGTVGSTGNSSGPHLHFEVRTSPGLYANRVDPTKYLP